MTRDEIRALIAARHPDKKSRAHILRVHGTEEQYLQWKRDWAIRVERSKIREIKRKAEEKVSMYLPLTLLSHEKRWMKEAILRLTETEVYFEDAPPGVRMYTSGYNEMVIEV